MKENLTKYRLTFIIIIALAAASAFNAYAQISRQSSSLKSSSNTSYNKPTQNAYNTNSTTYVSPQQTNASTAVPSQQKVREPSQKARGIVNNPSAGEKSSQERMETLASERKDLLWARYIEPGNPGNAYIDAGGGVSGQNAQRAFELWSQGNGVKQLELQGGLIVDAQTGRITDRQGRDVTNKFLKDLSRDVQIIRITFENGETVGGYTAAASELLFYLNSVQGNSKDAVETLVTDANGKPIKLSQKKGSKKQSFAKSKKKRQSPPVAFKKTKISN